MVGTSVMKELMVYPSNEHSSYFKVNREIF